MNIDINTYVPFTHEDFELKKANLDIARGQDTNTVEGTLTSTLVYMNAVDYIVSHLLENLKTMTYLVTHNEFSGVVFYRYTDKKGNPLGTLTKDLKNYDFPDKTDFISLLNKFTPLRNKFSHNLLKLGQSEIQSVDADLQSLRSYAEQLITKYDQIRIALINSWDLYKGNKTRLLPPPPLAASSITTNQNNSTNK